MPHYFQLIPLFYLGFLLIQYQHQQCINTFMKKVNEVINEKQDYNNQKKIQEEISKLENKLSNLIDLQLDGTISKEILFDKLISLL